jgi:hypothetical protein
MRAFSRARIPHVIAHALQTFWTIGGLRCVLVSQSGLQKHVVQVVKGDGEVLRSAFIGEPVEIEARAAAARLKGIFVDRAIS